MRDFWEDDRDNFSFRRDLFRTRDIYMTNGSSFSIMEEDKEHNENQLFDDVFATKLKAFYNVNNRYRRSGRTHLMAKIILELSIESGCPISIADHTDVNPSLNNRHVAHNILSQIRYHIDWYQHNGVDLEIIRFDLECIHVRLAPYRYSSNDTLKNYQKLRISDAEINIQPRKEKLDDLLLICCNIV